MRNIAIYGEGYKISRDGFVFNRHGKELSQSPGGNNDYLQVCLCHKGKSKRFLVHRLVALAYIGNHDEKAYVNHIDGNKQNNSVENLEWSTPSENMKHSYHVLGNRGGCIPMLGKMGAEHNKSKGITIRTPDGEVLEFGSVREMKRATGYENTSVTMMISTKKKELPYTFKRGKNKGMTVLKYQA